jgi:WD40 repeat protein
MSSALHQADNLNVSSKPRATTVIPSNPYVLGIAALPNFYATAASSPSNAIHIYDQRNLRAVSTLPGHSSITQLRAVDSIAGQNHRSLISSGKDGFVRLWDERAATVAIQSKSM